MGLIIAIIVGLILGGLLAHSILKMNEAMMQGDITFIELSKDDGNTKQLTEEQKEQIKKDWEIYKQLMKLK